MNMNTLNHSKQRGAALMVGLMLLVIVTLLAVTAVSTSSTELIMAGNEQFRERAFQAAEAGVETATRKVRSGDIDVPVLVGAFLDNSNVTMAYDATDRYSTRITALGANTLIGNSSKFRGQVFRIDSTGTSARNASSLHEVGTWVLSPFDDSNVDELTGGTFNPL